MTATYRYIFADLLTNRVLGDLPLQGVTFGRRISKPGNFQGSFGLDYSGFDNEHVLSMTEPGRTACYIERKNVINVAGGTIQIGPTLVWGGIIWTRTWQEQGKSLQMTGQTFESFPYQCDVRNTLVYAGIDQRNLIFNLWTVMQAMTNRNIGVIIPGNYVPDNILRTNTYFDYGAWTFGKIIDDQMALLNAPDFTIDVAYDSNKLPAKFLNVNDTLGDPVSQTEAAFDYPGNVNNFWWPLNAAKGAVSVAGVGAGQDATMIRSLISSSVLLANGYPDLAQFYTNKDTQTQFLLDSQTRQEAQRLALPITIPTLQLNPDLLPQLGEWGMGDYANFNLDSGYFVREGGKHISTERIIGWDVTPASSTSTESVKLILPGQ